MSGNSVLIDTNIAQYLLEGNTEAEQMLDGRKVYVSFVTQLELLGFKGISSSEKVHVESLLSDCIIIDINDAIKAHTIAIRERHRKSSQTVSSQPQLCILVSHSSQRTGVSGLFKV